MEGKIIMDTAKILYILILGLLIKNTGVGATDVSTQCQPFIPLFLWYTGTGEDDSFFQHRRFLIVSIDKLPEHTYVAIVTFGAENNLSLNFTKQAGHTNWRYNVLSYEPGPALKTEISVKETNKAIKNHYKRNDSYKAEIVYVLINNQTKLYGTEGDIRAQRKKKIFIISSGIQSVSKGKIWLELASDEHHFFELQGIQDTAKDVLTLTCQDSRFVCDTDMYWWYEKGRCNNCTYICSNSCTVQPDFCTQACPYFYPSWLRKKDESNSSHENIKCKKFDYSGITVITVVLILVVLVTLVLFVAIHSPKRRKLLRCICARLKNSYP